MPSQKRKLIFVWNYVEWGGAQIYFIGIMKLARKDWDVKVILPRGSDPKLLGFLGQIDVQYEFLERQYDLGPATSIRRRIERRFNILLSEIEVFRYLLRYDLSDSILHIEASPWQSSMLLAALAMRRANLFVTMHNALPAASALREFLWKLRIGLVSRLPRFHVFASNQDTKNRFRRWVSEAFWQTIRVTYTTVDPPDINRAIESGVDRLTLRNRFGIDENAFIVLCVGQFIDRKGRWVFVDAAKIAAKKYPDIRFVWLTSSAVSETDSKRIEKSGVGENFALISADGLGTDRQDILAFYRIADVYVQPSYVEGLPVALLEAMAMRLPSVSTNVYAIPEAIRHDETGLLIDAGDPNQLAEAVIRLWADEALRKRLAAAGREFVIAKFDERVASQIAIDAYKECLPDCQSYGDR